MVDFYVPFILRWSQLAAVLHGFKRKGACFVWADEHAAAFDSLKQALCQAPVLQILDFNKEFVLAADASDIAISAVLQQIIDGGLAPIPYHGMTLSPLGCKYSTYEKECLQSSLVARSAGYILNTRNSSCSVTIWLCAGY